MVKQQIGTYFLKRQTFYKQNYQVNYLIDSG